MIKLKIFSAIASAVLVLCLAAPAQAQSNRAWVSGKGSDAAGCGSPATPCRSFQYVHDNIIAAGGEIDVLDPAGYGAITITKALSIVNDGVGTAGVQQGTAGLNAITINAGTSDAVTLRGLNIDGLGTGGNGIVFNTGGSLAVVNCVVRHFANSASGTGNGILMQPSSSASNNTYFAISNTIASDNGAAGISYLPSSGAPNGDGVIDHVVAINNLIGIFVGGTTGDGYFTITNSVASNNIAYGMFFSTRNTAIYAAVDSSSMSNNGNGIFGNGAAKVLLSRSVITGNFGNGVINMTSPNTFYTYGDNRINGNPSGDLYGTALNTTFKPQ
ncbi:hypothetical protein [Methylocapsa sp. S129]|uniref:hypothetical protein n=1 Tax=Methylocapsa sp. S129 TaxID=1641869 RepID=UPI00131C9E6D|nr:hypothetical protein [Methylocapsa sp. S129]